MTQVLKEGFVVTPVDWQFAFMQLAIKVTEAFYARDNASVGAAIDEAKAIVDQVTKPVAKLPEAILEPERATSPQRYEAKCMGIDPGAGYRLLKWGERIRATDQWREASGRWSQTSGTGKVIGPSWFSDIYRRKVDAP